MTKQTRQNRTNVRGTCPHTETRPLRPGYTSCINCGVAFVKIETRATAMKPRGLNQALEQAKREGTRD